MLGNFSCATPAFTMLAAFREASRMERVECSVIGYSSSLRKCSLPFPGSSVAAFEAGSRQCWQDTLPVVLPWTEKQPISACSEVTLGH